jgi:hypothetical protein
MHWSKWLWMGLSAFAGANLAGCAASVDQFAPRVAAANQSIARADADNVVRNIVRAGLAEPLSFVAVSKVTDARTADLKIGLPTLTFGPAQMGAQKQWIFSSNGTDNSAGYSLELAPLRTDTFTKGLLDPIDPSQLENFTDQGFSRELLLYLFVDSVSVDFDSGAHHYVLWNDPSRENAADCPPPTTPKDYNPAKAKKPETCPFREFQYMLSLAVNYGAAVRASPSKAKDAQSYKLDLSLSESTSAIQANPPSSATDMAKPKAPVRSGGSKGANPASALCFSRDLAKRDDFFQQAANEENICAGGPSKKTLSLPLATGPDGKAINAEIAVTFRSPYRMFEYLGAVSQLPLDQQPRLWIFPQSHIDADRRLFPLILGRYSGCYMSLDYERGHYCLPQNAYDAKMAVNVLILLLQMNTNRADLPTSAVNVQF